MRLLSNPASLLLPLALVWSAAPEPARAQARPDSAPGATVSGVVITAKDATPLPRVLVSLVPLDHRRPAAGRNQAADTPGRELSYLTGTDGRYRFSGVPPGRYRLLITREGYEPAAIELELGSATTLTLSAVLELAPVSLQAVDQDTAAVVTGQVLDAETGRPLANVAVLVEGTELSTLTDADGRYWLVGAPAGPRVLRARLIGFAPARVSIVVPARGTVERDIRIAANPLLLPGVVVTADPVSRARGELGTASVIDQQAIRHQTATSLAGVLELVPGVPVQPPGLDDLQQIALRAVRTSGSGVSRFALAGGTRATDLASFGTLIIVDGVPQSNNANLQSLGARGELGFTTSSSGGIDLRQIPASTLERVEVIRGVPSARWSDLTQGVIIVDTRAGDLSPEIKAQYDARTTEVSLVGGRAFGTVHTGTTKFDFAGTRTQPGRSDDYAYRVAAQLMHRAELGRGEQAGAAPKLRLDTRLDFYQLFDDRPENPRVGRNRASTSRDRGFRLTERLRLALGARTRLFFTGALTAVGQRSHSRAELNRTALPFTDRITEGRQEGHFVIGPYAADVKVEGNPWLGYGRLELAGERDFLGVSHALRGGLELRREWNGGPGTQFDIEFPPQVTFNGVNGYDRPRSYDDIPALVTSALYLDDRLSTSLGSMVLQLQAGVRLDLLHRGSSWFSGVRDAVLQPRVNLELSPAPWLRLRGGFGRTAKAPNLGLLSPAPQYYDVLNVNYFANDPVERLAVLTTFIRDPSNDDLGFARATKAEAGVELGLGAAALSLVAFRDRISDGFSYRGDPIFLLREHFTLTDSVLGNGIKPDIIEPAERADTVPVLLLRPDNLITQTNRGFELTAFLPEIPQIRTRLQVTGSWVETRQRSDALYYGKAEDFGNFQLQEIDRRMPYWEGATEVGKRVLLQYRLIHHQPHAGLIITATIQHNVSDDFRDIAGTDTLAFQGYVTRDAQLVPVPQGERGRDEFRDLRLPRSGLLVEPLGAPADWMLSVQVSKTLPLDGRLNFWAFNLLDRRGQVDVGFGAMRRPYLPVRVGLELTVPVRALVRWGNQ